METWANLQKPCSRAAASKSVGVADMTKKTDLDLYALLDQHHDRVRKFILITVKDEWIADDLAQETFLRAYKNLDRLRDPSKISAWLLRTAYNLCMDHFRSA